MEANFVSQDTNPNNREKLKMGLEFVFGAVVISVAALSSFIWIPVGAAASAIGGLVGGLAWGFRTGWQWYESKYRAPRRLQRSSKPVNEWLEEVEDNSDSESFWKRDENKYKRYGYGV